MRIASTLICFHVIPSPCLPRPPCGSIAMDSEMMDRTFAVRFTVVSWPRPGPSARCRQNQRSHSAHAVAPADLAAVHAGEFHRCDQRNDGNGGRFDWLSHNRRLQQLIVDRQTKGETPVVGQFRSTRRFRLSRNAAKSLTASFQKPIHTATKVNATSNATL